MRQVVFESAERIVLRDVTPPEPRAGEILIRSHAVGICGSDLHALHGSHPWIDLPVVPGHEVSGTVEAVGAETAEWAVGDRVLLEPNLICGECARCRSGRYNLCERLQVVGCQTVGAMADLFIAPGHRLHRVPEGMTMTDAALVEPLSTATHAVRVSGDLACATVVVLGAGSIGLLTALAARSAGARQVAITDPIAGKRNRAVALGAADLALDPLEPGVVERLRSELGDRPDVVLDCVANQASTDQAVALAVKGGTVTVVGVPTSRVSLDLATVQDAEIRIQGTAMYVVEDVLRAIELLQQGAIRGADVVTGHFALEQVEDALTAARSGDHVKVQLDLL